jgi:hypothetical protein
LFWVSAPCSRHTVSEESAASFFKATWEVQMAAEIITSASVLINCHPKEGGNNFPEKSGYLNTALCQQAK